MCGIAGYISKMDRPDEGVLHRMLASLGHRGPDQLSGFIEGPAALGTARLSIVDLDGGLQPAVTTDRRVAVVFNGEIYNYREHRDRLIKSGHTFKTRSEVETLLHLYLEQGPDFVTALNGQFAIAVWDGRDNTLHLFRDRVGIRPLFWHVGPSGTIFGSEIKALLAHGAVDPKLNRQAVIQTFRMWTMAGQTTAFSGVKQVPPAHHLAIKDGTVVLRRWWEWPIPGEQVPLTLSSDEEYFEAFRENLGQAVARRRMADVPVASYLSGGIDSSVLAHILSEQAAPDVLETFSIQFDDPEYDETSAQARVASHLGVNNKTVRIGANDIERVFPQVVWQAEAPLFRTAPAPLFHLSQQVHKDGIKVVMTGEGADEVLLGYDLFREVAIRRFWARSPDSEWRGALFRRLYAYIPQFRNPRYQAMVLDFYRPHLADRGDRHYAMAPRWANGAALEHFFSAEMNELSRNSDPISALDSFLPAGYDEADDIDRAQAVECQTLMANYLLSSQGDRMSMAHAVEGRYPYLDHEFIEFAARLPRRVKLRSLKDKFVLRGAYADKLPKEVWDRPKVAYQSPDLKAFFNNGQVPDYVEELMAPERIADVGLFNPRLVEQLMAKGRSFKLPRVGVRDNMACVLILSTMLLDEIFIRKGQNMMSDVKFSNKLQLV